MTGVDLGGDAELRFARVGAGGGVAVSMAGSPSRLEDARLAGAVGILVHSDESSVSRVRIRARTHGVVVKGGVANVDDAAILLTGPVAAGLMAWGDAEASAISAGYVTVASTDPGATGVVASSNAGKPAFVRLENSVISGTDTALAAYGAVDSALIETHHSNYDPAATKAEGAFADLLEEAVTTHPPGFVAPAAGDLRLRPDSELIDLGDPTPVVAAGTDAIGSARVVNGTPDLGAFEYQALAPKARIAPLAPVVAGRPVTLDGSGSSDGDPGDGIATWTWSVAGATTATGPKLTRTFARAGSYGVELTVTDTTGRTGTAVRTIVVLAPPRVPARADHTAPIVSGLRVGPRRAGRRARIRFAVSEPAAVVMKLRRRARAGWKPVATIRRTAGAGAVSVRMRRRLRHSRYRVLVTATDAAGNRATPARRDFRAR